MRGLLAFLLVVALLVPAHVDAQQTSEFRGFWVDAFHSGFKSPAQVEQLVVDAERANANALLVQVRRRGDAYYLSSVEPRTTDAALAPAPYDPLRALIDAAHVRGIEVHAWIATLAIARATRNAQGQCVLDLPEGHVLQRHGVGAADDWVSRDDAGNVCTSENDLLLDPGAPGVAEYTTQVTTDLLRRYHDLDGLHLDRVRYNAARWGYNPVAIARFQAEYGGGDVPAWNDQDWSNWRRGQVTELVRQVSESAHAQAPHVRVSVAAIAFSDGPQALGGWQNSAPYKQVFQDWSGWLKAGIIDTAIVMNYDNNDNPTHQRFFNNWVDWETSEAGGEVVVGPAAYLNCVGGTLAQVERAEQRGALGTALYSYAVLIRETPAAEKCNQSREHMLDALANGPWAGRVLAPLVHRDERGALRGVLGGPGLPTARAGVVIALGGPENRILVTNQYGAFHAAALPPGHYVLAVALDQGRLLVAEVQVDVDEVAVTNNWRVATLDQQLFVPLMQMD